MFSSEKHRQRNMSVRETTDPYEIRTGAHQSQVLPHIVFNSIMRLICYEHS